MTSTENTARQAIDQFREILPAMDPAALTSADVSAILDLLHVYYEAAAIK